MSAFCDDDDGWGSTPPVAKVKPSGGDYSATHQKAKEESFPSFGAAIAKGDCGFAPPPAASFAPPAPVRSVFHQAQASSGEAFCQKSSFQAPASVFQGSNFEEEWEERKSDSNSTSNFSAPSKNLAPNSASFGQVSVSGFNKNNGRDGTGAAEEWSSGGNRGERAFGQSFDSGRPAAAKSNGFGSSSWSSSTPKTDTNTSFGAGAGSGFDTSTSFGVGNGSGGGWGNADGFGAGGTSSGFGGDGNRRTDGGGSGRGCFNCGDESHRKQDCPNPPVMRCRECNETGHKSYQCPSKGAGGSGFETSFSGREGSFGNFGGGGFSSNANDGSRSNKCFNCQEEGHRSADCPNPRKPDTCYNCNQEGHRSSECTAERKGPIAANYEPEQVSVDNYYKDSIKSGDLFEKFFKAPITVKHDNKEVKPALIGGFDELGLGSTFMSNLLKAGYSKPSPIQQCAMPIVMKGDDLLASAQTGSGKTAAFLLPIMKKLMDSGDLSNSGELPTMPRCLILAPTRELVMQIDKNAKMLGNGTVLSSMANYGGLRMDLSRSFLQRGATILVSTTGRLKHFIEEGLISLEKIRFLVLDEADRMLDEGFGTEIEALVPKLPQNRQTVMFSATFPDTVMRLARQLLKPSCWQISVGMVGAANDCISQNVIVCEKSEKLNKLYELLNMDMNKNRPRDGSDIYEKKTLIFVQKKSFADTLGIMLSEQHLPSMTMHGDRDMRQRQEALNMFRSGKKPVLVSSAVLERGMDIRGIDHVINYDMPQTIDQYVHRIGRTGRVGNAGVATSFFVPGQDDPLAADLVRILQEAGQIVPDSLEAISGGGYGASYGSSFGFSSNSSSGGAASAGDGW